MRGCEARWRRGHWEGLSRLPAGFRCLVAGARLSLDAARDRCTFRSGQQHDTGVHRTGRPGRGCGGADRETRQAIVSRLHYRGGLTRDRLVADFQAAGFVEARPHGVAPIYLCGLRSAPLAEQLQLLAPSRCAVFVQWLQQGGPRSGLDDDIGVLE